MRRAVFLDRDGVINRAMVRQGKPYPPAGLEELEIVPGAGEALSQLKDRGFALIVVTNQPDVARGATSRATVEAINARLARDLPIDEFRVCYHDSADGCGCRKPKPGLLVDAARERGIDCSASFMVGDRWRDVEAGKAAGCTTIFVDYQYDERRPEGSDYTVGSLDEAVKIILATKEKQVKTVEQLKIKIFADGADKAGMLEMYRKPFVKGLTTNPTLMRKVGITDYRAFAKDILKEIPDRPISFEVFSDEFPEMERQAMEIASWGDNVYVKIPVTNTRREPSYDVIRNLAGKRVKLNITAMMTLTQVRDVVAALNPAVPSYVSVLAGRIADTGRDPVPLMAAAVEMLKVNPKAELIWASPRELLNIFQADSVGCQVITVTNDVLKKLSLVGMDLDEYSLDTVKMFRNDAVAAGFNL
jgi:transaldolase